MNQAKQKRMPFCDRRLVGMTYTPRHYKMNSDVGSRAKTTRNSSVHITATNNKRVF